MTPKGHLPLEKAIPLLSPWISPEFLDPKKFYSFQKQFLKSKPYPHLVLNSFLIEKKAQELFASIQTESFTPKQSDLFCMSQTLDLASTQQELLKSFHTFSKSNAFLSFMHQLTGYELQPNKLDLAGTLYEEADFLLCHDDQLEGRKIAFLLYLSTLKRGEGGSLDLYYSKQGKPVEIVEKIFPKFNTFAFFEVSPTSFHQVDEVIVDKKRYALGGWLYEE